MLTEEYFDEVAVPEAMLNFSREFGQAKLLMERFNADLIWVKTQHTDKLEWGETKWALLASKKVLEMAWRDS